MSVSEADLLLDSFSEVRSAALSSSEMSPFFARLIVNFFVSVGTPEVSHSQSVIRSMGWMHRLAVLYPKGNIRPI